MSKPKLIAGNWKLNPADSDATLELLRQLKARLAPFTKTQMAVIPPFTMLHLAMDVLKGTRIAVGGQNLYWEDRGAFTGEVSAPMLKSAGCKYVVIGHSERRQLFGETNDTVHRKIPAALKCDLTPIVCVGETLSEREGGVMKEVVREQVTQALRGMDEKEVARIVLAYEPVWAIGTGKTATPAQAQEMHRFIRELLTDLYRLPLADGLLILYGGSVKADNAAALLGQPDIDGALVGGASLQAEGFAEIVKAAELIA
jgi:triosephosphate isomerase